MFIQSRSRVVVQLEEVLAKPSIVQGRLEPGIKVAGRWAVILFVIECVEGVNRKVLQRFGIAGASDIRCVGRPRKECHHLLLGHQMVEYLIRFLIDDLDYLGPSLMPGCAKESISSRKIEELTTGTREAVHDSLKVDRQVVSILAFLAIHFPMVSR